VGIVVDEEASDQQAQALERILSGQEGGVFGDFTPLIGEYLGMERAPVTFSDGDTPTASVAGRTEIRFDPLRGVDGSPTTVMNAAFGLAPEYKIGRGVGHSDAFGLTYDGRYGESADFSYSSEPAPGGPRGRA